jgi:hypothetical protein
MGFLEDAGEFLFGSETAKKAKANTEAATARSAQIAADAQNAYDAGAAQSMGANAGEFMKNANLSAQQNASQQAALAANQGARASLKAMKTGGMNPAAAAARAGQQAGANYAGTFGQGVQQGVGQYMQGAQQFSNQASDIANRGATNTQLQMTGAKEQRDTADATAKNTMNVGQMALGAILQPPKPDSDARVKEDITPASAGRISAILAKIDPVKYRYKDQSMGEGEQVGITAQNLEQAGLGGVVETGPEGTKVINSGKVENFNLDAIKTLNDKIDRIIKHLGGAK